MSKGPVSNFIQHHYRHFNAAALMDAAKGYETHLLEGGKMLVSLAGAMSTAELGISLAEMIRQDKVQIISCTGANLEEEIVVSKTDSTNEISADDDDVVKRIKELLENYVKPAVEMDGGAIQFKSYNEGTVNLMMQGSCSGCPSSMITLKAGIEGMMKRMIPEVKEVVAESE